MSQNHNDIQTLHEAAKILGRNGRHAAARDCTEVSAVIATDIALGGPEPRPAPGNRLERLAPRPGRIGGAL